MSGTFERPYRMVIRTSVESSSLPFLPERFTPLFHTPAYHLLQDQEKLRYNQLCGLCMHEYTIFFEEEVSRAHVSLSSGSISPSLQAMLVRFVQDETRHAAAFRAFNQRCAPEYYSRGIYFISRLSSPARAIVNAMASRPLLFPCIFWLFILHEEKLMNLELEVDRCAASLDPSFVALHRTHCADETDHVSWQEELLHVAWVSNTAWIKHLNAAIFAWTLENLFLVPRRSALRIIDVLAGEFPRLSPLVPQLHSSLRALADDKSFRLAWYPAESLRTTFALFDQNPEMQSIARVLPSYLARPSTPT